MKISIVSFFSSLQLIFERWTVEKYKNNRKERETDNMESPLFQGMKRHEVRSYIAQRERQKLKRRKRRGRPRHSKGVQNRPSPDISRATLPFLPRIRHEICVPVPLSMSKMPPYGKKGEGRKSKRILAYTEDELSRGPAVYRTAKRLGPGGPFAAIAFFLAGTLERRGGLLISVYAQSLSFRSKSPANPWKRMLLPCKSVTDLLRCLGRTALADRWKKAMAGDILAEQCARSYAVSALLCHPSI